MINATTTLVGIIITASSVIISSLITLYLNRGKNESTKLQNLLSQFELYDKIQKDSEIKLASLITSNEEKDTKIANLEVSDKEKGVKISKLEGIILDIVKDICVTKNCPLRTYISDTEINKLLDEGIMQKTA